VRALIQRVREAEVRIDGQLHAGIGAGLLVLVCAMQGDGETQAVKLAQKIARLRIFRDDAGKMNLSVTDRGGSVLVVSQFTLAADLRGNRPGFSTAAAPAAGEALYLRFVALLAAQGLTVRTGVFGADMAVGLVNDGPVTIWMDTDSL
jgi:D-aminoacyl-tRNA deacylase